MLEVYNFLKSAGTFYIATIDGDKPRVRPFGALNLFKDRIYIQTGKIKNVYNQIVINNKVEITAVVDDKWIRIECTLVDDEDIEAKKSMLDNNPMLRSMYSETDDNTKVLYLSNVTATIYSFTSAPVTYNF